ncbi:unnamed protein product [Schistocephalus solidus]|uniref:DNA-directed RNA polymerase III subunit RPC3 n=1 Tax=Schistocephalus solidus TaxID=70667 RepID=A0A3P7CIX5_SCHSO|nr:unnamed protein product [Schistocephalus solidus]
MSSTGVQYREPCGPERTYHHTMSDIFVEYFDHLLKNRFGDAAVAIVRSMHIRGSVSLKDIDRSLSGKMGQRSKEDYRKSELLVDTLAILTKTGLLQCVKAVCPTEVCDEEQERPSSESTTISKTELLDSLQKFVSAGGKVEKFRQNLPTAGDIMSRLLCVANTSNRSTHILSAACEAVSHAELERRLLIPQKDFRRVLPRMVANGFISTTEFSSAKDFNADSIVCLYHVNLPVLARMLIEYSQHTLLRIDLRSQAELKEKSRLVEQRYRIENLIRQYEAKIAQLSTSQPLLASATTTDAADDNADPESLLAHHQESIRALKSSMTPGELEQLTALTARLSK